MELQNILLELYKVEENNLPELLSLNTNENSEFYYIRFNNEDDIIENIEIYDINSKTLLKTLDKTTQHIILESDNTYPVSKSLEIVVTTKSGLSFICQPSLFTSNDNAKNTHTEILI